MDTVIVIMVLGLRDWQKYEFLKPETDNIEFVYKSLLGPLTKAEMTKLAPTIL